MGKKKNIPSMQQLCDEFGLHASNLSKMKKTERGKKRIQLYSDAWLYRVIISAMPVLQQKQFDRITPSVKELFEEFGTSKQNFYQLSEKGTRLYNVYVDAWNLRHNILSKLRS